MREPRNQTIPPREPAPGVPPCLESERLTPRVLPPFLRSADLFVNTQVVLLWLINASGAATGGPVSLLYWFIGGVGFFVPTVIATAQLWTLYPGEGSLYSWTYRAFARTGKLNVSFFLSFLVGACFWVIGPLALVIGATAFLSFLQALLPAPWLTRFLAQPWQQGLLMIGLVLLSQVLIAQRGIRLQRLVTYTFGANLLAFALIVLAGVVWMMRGHASATAFTDPTGWQPNPSNFGLFGLICLGYLGAPTALTMSGEIRSGTSQRRVVRSLVWGALLVVLCYHLATWALLVILGPAALASAPNLNFTLVQIVGQVLGAPWAVIAAMCLMTFFLISPLVYCLASSRLLVMGGLDQRLPGKLSTTTARHVPRAAFWVQTLFAVGLLVLVYLIAPAITSLGQPANLAAIIYNVVLAALTLIFLLATFFLFINLWLALRYDKHHLATHRVFPLPVLWGSIILGMATCILVAIDTLWNSLVPQLVPNANWFLAVGLCLVFCGVTVVIISVVASGEAASQRLVRLYRDANAV